MERTITRAGYVLRLCRYIKGMKIYLALSVLFNLLFKLTPIVIGLVTAYLINAAVLGDIRYLWQTFAVICALIVLSAIFAYLDVLVSHDMAYRILAQLRDTAYDKIDELAPAAMEGEHSAALTSIVLEDVEQLEWFYAHVIGQLIVAIVIPSAALLFLGYCSPVLPLALIPFIVLMVAVPVFFAKKANTQGVNVKECYAELNARIVDGVQGMKDIISFGWQDTFFARFEKALRAHQDAQMAYAVRSGEESRRFLLVMGLGSLCGELTAAILTVTGRLDAVWLIPVFQLCGAIFGPLQDALTMSTNYGLIFGAAKRLFHLLERKPAVQDTPDSREMHLKNEEPVTVAFENVGFAYPSESENACEPVLKNFSFSFSTGETVALVGASGSGKTTVSRLLQRFWDVDGGSIRINGTDIRNVKLDSLRDLITVVPQEVYLFHLSVTENLRLAKADASMEEIEEAAKAAQADAFIHRLPKGYDTLLGERGLRLSGGEKQRISIAQAFLKNAPVLVLDEASANLDSETERQVNLAVNRLKKGRATLVIAHRVSTIKSADRIIVLHDGIAEAEGTYAELMEQCAYFRRLVGGEDYGEA
ncbi:MAG: ABC transporter ATP-binding protein [Eubacteriales bacterium]|nr:ABC transporter ATP-binding protein [Eubacteriales bacterium]